MGRDKNKEAKRDYKIFSTTDDEKRKIKRILTTVGFFNTAIEGMNYSLEVEQRRIEERVKVGKAKEGYSLHTMIDPETLNLFVREVKKPEPAKEEKK
jgi:ribosomal protein S16